eukprot:4554612-Amphidinium_carterae.1
MIVTGCPLMVLAMCLRDALLYVLENLQWRFTCPRRLRTELYAANRPRFNITFSDSQTWNENPNLEPE